MDPLLKRKHFSNALDLAIYGDDFEGVKWLVEEYLPPGRIRGELESAASSGQSRTIRWLWEHHRSRVVWTSILGFNAAINRHLELAKWLHGVIGLESPEAKKRIKSFAIHSGSVAMLEWAIELGACICTDDIHAAARHGQASILEWFVRVKNFRATKSLVASAIRGGQPEAVEWLSRQLGVVSSVPRRELGSATSPLVSQAIEYMNDKRRMDLARGIDDAAARNDLELVKCLHEKSSRGSCTTDAMDNAAKAGHLEMVTWLHENRSEGCTTQAMDEAARHGHLDVVEWLHENRSEGCTTQAMDGAAEHGHLEVVKWLHTHRVEGCTTDAMNAAAECGNLGMVKWLHENRYEGCTADAMDDAASNGHLDVVQWLHWNRHERCTTRAMDEVVEIGRLDILQWLHEHCSEGCTENAMANAAAGNNLRVVQWLVATGHAQVTWEAVMLMIFYDQHDIVKWMLSLLPDEMNARQVGRVRSLEMAQLLHADGRSPLDSKAYRCALKWSDWQLFQWLMREYPDAILTPSELEEAVGEGNGDEIKFVERTNLAYMHDAIYEFEQLRKD